uniref:glycosyltransferase family 4 protein n=1 Tax=uncultured Halomonas sp. TaxID=173971 RepID=UPI00260BF641|nr:glycosyltransferase family 4 protein [uncultured Halomonas sp.]
MLRAGLEVHAIAPGLDKVNSTNDVLRDWGVVTHHLPLSRAGLNPLCDVVVISKLFTLFRINQPDIVFSYTVKPVIYSMVSAWLSKVPNRYALITGLGYAFTGEARGKRGLVKRLVRRLYSRALKRADRVFFQNSDDEQLFRKLGLLGEVVPSQVVNGSGIDTDYFKVAMLPTGSHRFLLIARLLGDKGVREYVAAAAQVREHYPEAVFCLAGDIDTNPDSITRQELNEWRSAGHIEYLGHLDDVRPAIADASVYVLPSYREGTPRTVLEAMAMGRPIITTDAPGCRETVVEGENGYLVPVKAVQELAEAMIQFIEAPELVARMGARSRDIAVDKYDVHKVNAVMLESMGIAFPANAGDGFSAALKDNSSRLAKVDVNE